MKLVGSLTSASLLVSLSACAPAMTQAPPRLLSSDLQVGRLSERTAFEQTDAVGKPRGDSDDVFKDSDDAQRKRKAAFIGGVVAASLGGALAVGFGAAGQITERQLDKGYDDGLTRTEESDLRDRGKAFNGVAIGGAALSVVGIGLTAIVLGLDYNRCGNLLKKRRKECEDKPR